MTGEHDRVLYVGVTRDLSRRARQHREGSFRGFSLDYRLNRLLYFEVYDTAKQAIAREHQLRSWHRQWKLDLIKETNPELRNISDGL